MGYRVHRILQARIPEWVAVPFSRESSQPRDRTQVSRIAGQFFTNWAIREVHLALKRVNNAVYYAFSIQKTKIMASGPVTSWQIDGETVETVADFIKSLQMVIAAMKLKDTYSLEGKLWPT